MFDLAGKDSVNRIILEEMRQSGSIGQVVDRHKHEVLSSHAALKTILPILPKPLIAIRSAMNCLLMCISIKDIEPS